MWWCEDKLNGKIVLFGCRPWLRSVACLSSVLRRPQSHASEHRIFGPRAHPSKQLICRIPGPFICIRITSIVFWPVLRRVPPGGNNVGRVFCNCSLESPRTFRVAILFELCCPKCARKVSGLSRNRPQAPRLAPPSRALRNSHVTKDCARRSSKHGGYEGVLDPGYWIFFGALSR